ncbi:putative lytic transglycosylase [Vibrio phage 121E34-1]|nr:putative lytic transglycosylase [Vibrio phage 131E34-1]CAH9011517.1 putative lytic transglycosylase [Vibrio phage 121E34-1]
MFEQYQKRARVQVDTTASTMGAQALSSQQQTERQAMSVTHRATQSIMEGIGRIAGTAIDYQNALIKKENNEILNQAAIDGELSVSMGQYQADMKEGDDLYTTAYNQAAKAKVNANVRTYANNRIAEIAAQHPDDPEAFRASVAALNESMTEELKLGGDGQVILNRTIDEGYARFAPNIVKNGYNLAKREETAAFNETMVVTSNTALNDIRAGNFNRLESLYEDWGAVFDEGVKRGIYAEEDKAKVFRGLLLEGNEQMVMSYADAAESSSNFVAGRNAIEAWKESAIETGQFSPDQIDAVYEKGNEAINRAEYAHTQQLKTKKKDLEAAQVKQNHVDIVTKSLDSGFALPKNKANQKSMDVFANEYMKDFDLQNPEHVAAMAQIVGTTKLIPTQVIESLDRAALSNNTGNVEGATAMYEQLKTLSPRTLANSTDPNTAAFYENTSRLTKAGLTSEEAQEIAFKNVYAQDSAQKEVLRSRISSSEYKETRTDAAQDAFNERATGWFSPDDLSELGAAGLEYEADYQTMFDSFYQKTGGDIEAAKSLTNDRIQKKWAVTDINGRTQPMRFSPESLYGGDGDNSWISEQWQEHDLPELKAQLGLPEDADLQLISHVETGRSKPTWKILQVIRNEDGAVTNMIDVQDANGTSLTWYPSWDKYSERMGIGDRAEKRLQSAKHAWEAGMVTERKGASIPRSYGFFPEAEQKFSTKMIRGW